MAAVTPHLCVTVDLCDRSAARAAAKRRHPAAEGVRTPLPAGPSFRAAAALLCGPWRVTDPDGYVNALTTAPRVAGHRVCDPADQTAPGGLADALRSAVGEDRLDVAALSGEAGGLSIVEGRALLPATTTRPGLLAVAHLRTPTRRPSAAAVLPGSWLFLLVGDAAGGVAGAVRLFPGGAAIPPSLRFALRALTGRILDVAVAAPGRPVV